MSYTEQDRQDDVDRITNAPRHMREFMDKGIYPIDGEVGELLQACEALQAERIKVVEALEEMVGCYNPTKCEGCHATVVNLLAKLKAKP